MEKGLTDGRSYKPERNQQTQLTAAASKAVVTSTKVNSVSPTGTIFSSDFELPGPLRALQAQMNIFNPGN